MWDVWAKETKAGGGKKHLGTSSAFGNLSF